MSKICGVCGDEIPDDGVAVRNSNGTWSCWKHLSREQLQYRKFPVYASSTDKPKTTPTFGDVMITKQGEPCILKTSWHSMKVEKPEPRMEIYFITNPDKTEPSLGYRLRREDYETDDYVQDEDHGYKFPMQFILAWRYVRPEFTADDLAAIRAMEAECEHQR